jgi:hypothetical protein
MGILLQVGSREGCQSHRGGAGGATRGVRATFLPFRWLIGTRWPGVLAPDDISLGTEQKGERNGATVSEGNGGRKLRQTQQAVHIPWRN